MKFSALNIDFNSVRFDPLGSRGFVRAHQIRVYSLQNARFLLLSTNLAREWLQIDTYLLHTITSTADELSGDTNIDDLERPWIPKIGVFIFFRDFRLRHTFHEWSAPKSLEIDQDNLHLKFSALNVDFYSASFDPLGSRSPPYRGIKFGYPRWKGAISATVDLSRSRTVADRHRFAAYYNKHCWRPFRGTNINDLERPWNRKKRVFSEFCVILGCEAHLKTEFSPKLLEIDHDNLRTKLKWCCRAPHEH